VAIIHKHFLSIRAATFHSSSGADWTSQADDYLKGFVARGQEIADSLPAQPNNPTWGNSSTIGGTTTINFGGANWGTTQVGTGTIPFRDNNPGDIVSSGFTNNHGAIDSDGRFGVFPTSGQGYQALDSLLHGGSYVDLSISDAIARYAPAMENNTAGYQQFLTNALGVSGNTPLSSLSPAQFQTLENAISRFEGINAPGNYSVTVTYITSIP
jgi:hypothetical protein